MVSFAAGECRAAAPPPEGVARIHYHRPDGAYAGWGLHVWEHTTASVTWPAPLAQTGRDDFGVHLGRAVGREGGEGRLHRSQGRREGSRPRHVAGPGRAGPRGVDRLRRRTLFTAPPDVSAFAFGDLTALRAHWLARDLLAWPAAPRAGDVFRLHASADAGLAPAADGVRGGECVPPDRRSRRASARDRRAVPASARADRRCASAGPTQAAPRNCSRARCWCR